MAKRAINLKPLARRAGRRGGRIRKDLKPDIRSKLEKEIRTSIRREISKTNWHRKPGAKFKAGIKVRVHENSVSISITGPALYQDQGVKKNQMKYLRGKVVKFKPRGEPKPIYRTVSTGSLRRGGWTHPGSKGKKFMDRALESAKDLVADQIAQAYVDDLVAKLSD